MLNHWNGLHSRLSVSLCKMDLKRRTVTDRKSLKKIASKAVTSDSRTSSRSLYYYDLFHIFIIHSIYNE